MFPTYVTTRVAKLLPTVESEIGVQSVCILYMNDRSTVKLPIDKAI